MYGPLFTTLPVLRRTVDSLITVGKVRKNSESLLLEAGAVAEALFSKRSFSLPKISLSAHRIWPSIS